MSRIAASFKVVALAMLWAALVEIPGAPLSGLSLIGSAHAAPPAAHKTARPAPRRRNVDVDVDVDRRGRGRRDVDVDVDVDRRGRHKSVDVDVDVDRRPRVGAVAVGVAVGTTIAALPRSCTTVVTDDVTYHHCDGVYYRPRYSGTKVVYVVVDAP
jgi:hypothetical protein